MSRPMAYSPRMRAILAIAMTISTAAQGDELAKKSLKSWRAFECSILAEKIGDSQEQVRLFQVGYTEGMAFLKALSEERLTADDVRKHAPLSFTFRLGGPSHDFRMGRIFEGAVSKVFKDVLKEETDTELVQLLAENEFRRRNCALIQ